MAGEWNWDDTWTATSIAASTITDTSTDTTGTIANDNKLGTMVGVTIAYGGTATEGVKVYVFWDVDGSFEAVADDPWGFEMPATTSTTHRRAFVVPAGAGDDFRIHLTNDSGASVTATVDYKQAVAAT